MATKYQPPKQRRSGQIIDCIFIVALVYVCLLMPLLMGGGASTYVVPGAQKNPTWESLQQNSAMQAQWQKLGMNEQQAGELINTRFSYAINPWTLGLTVIVIIAYFAFMLKWSDKEYREVINEKFGPEGQSTSTRERSPAAKPFKS